MRPRARVRSEVVQPPEGAQVVRPPRTVGAVRRRPLRPRYAMKLLPHRRSRAVSAALFFATALAGCPEPATSPDAQIGGDAHVAPHDAGPPLDTAPPDAGAVVPDAHVVVPDADSVAIDAATDAGALPSCSGEAPSALFLDRVDAAGDEHWLRRTASTTLYVTLPAGLPRRAALPAIYEIVRTCGASSFAVAHAASGEVVRLDWVLRGTDASLCVRRGFADDDAALAAELLDATELSTGCAGQPWTALRARDEAP